MILLAPKYGFDVLRTKVSTIEQYSDGFRLYVGDKVYNVLSYDMDSIIDVMNLTNEVVENNKKNSKKQKYIHILQ